MFYALQQTRRAKRVTDVALVRVEQLLPFPHEALARRLGGAMVAKIATVHELKLVRPVRGMKGVDRASRS